MCFVIFFRRRRRSLRVSRELLVVGELYGDISYISGNPFKFVAVVVVVLFQGEEGEGKGEEVCGVEKVSCSSLKLLLLLRVSLNFHHHLYHQSPSLLIIR